MLLCSANSIVVEVVNYERASIGREVDVELEEEGDEARRRGEGGGEG